MDIHLQKKNNVDTDLTSFTKINSWWIIDLRVKIKSLEDNITENLDNLRYGDAFSDTRPKVWPMKEINSKLNYITIKNYCSMKDNVKEN